MGLFTGLLTLPLAPVRGVIWLGERLREEALRRTEDPIALRRRLEEVERARDAGEITEEEAVRLEEDIIQRLLGSSGPPVGGAEV